MQFLFPGFLWALAALAIPIILHLFYFRRYKKVYFSNVRFLKEVKEETSARNKLRNLLILLMRCLALAALVFAFAQPFIPVSDQMRQGVRHVSLFVDNSFSMQSFGQALPLLDDAKRRAQEIIQAHADQDRFQVLTHDLSSREQRYISKDEALAYLEDVDITSTVSPLSKVASRQSLSYEKEQATNRVAYWVSDFQSSIVDHDLRIDSTIDLTIVPVQSVQEKNVSIDSAWFEAPTQMLNQSNPLVVRVTNYSNDDVENIKLTMDVDGQEKPLGALNIPAGESVIDTANITILKTGWHEVVLRITDFPVQFDDTYYMSFYVDEEINVLSINGALPNMRLQAAYQNNTYFNLQDQSIAQLNYSTMRENDLVILNEVRTVTSGMTEELYNFINSGGKVLFFPAGARQPADYQSFLARCGANTFGAWTTDERHVGYINTDEFIFHDVFIRTNRNLRLPTVKGSYATNTLQSRASEKILGYRDGGIFLAKYGVGRGNLYVCSAPLNDNVSNLARNAEIFIPLLYKVAVSRGTNRPAAYTIGAAELIEVDAADLGEDKVFTFSGATEFIPGITRLGSKALLDPGDQISAAGFYDLTLDAEPRGVYGYNYDRRESDLAYQTVDQIKAQFGPSVEVLDNTAKASLTSMIEEKEQGIQLWRWFIILALVFLALEVLIIRIWKT